MYKYILIRLVIKIELGNTQQFYLNYNLQTKNYFDKTYFWFNAAKLKLTIKTGVKK